MDGGTGNDMIVYDASDLLVSGGEGIDFLISCDDIPSFDVLKGSGSGHPQVSNVEVAIYGEEVLGLTSIDKLAEKGISISDDGRSLTFDISEGWAQSGNTFTSTEHSGLTVQIDSSAFSNVEVDNAANLIILTQIS